MYAEVTPSNVAFCIMVQIVSVTFGISCCVLQACLMTVAVVLAHAARMASEPRVWWDTCKECKLRQSFDERKTDKHEAPCTIAERSVETFNNLLY